jgi:flavin reductase (DIM6/NTAB) family NADH-FMN oxidoreductase RutF
MEESEEVIKRQKAQEEWVQLKDPKLRSRLLYSNPVCLLTTKEEDKLNVMVISWLSCTDNHAGIMLSINKRR